MSVAGGPRQGYHHGDLRQALIRASLELVEEQGAAQFSLADACRRAGVSTAAPYRHFSGKQAILETLIEAGFDQLSERFLEVTRNRGGSATAIYAMGQEYVRFAAARPALFRLMFGQDPALKACARVQDSGQRCFGLLIAQVEDYCQTRGRAGEARRISMQLWTYVHGAAALLIDGDYQHVAPGLDLEALVEDGGRRLLERPD
jgi:AcrR family transcriptional regulator